MEQAPMRMFKSHNTNSMKLPVISGRSKFNPDTGDFTRIGKIVMQVQKDGTIKTNCPATINAIFTKYRNRFKKPIYRTQNGVTYPEIVGYSDEVLEIFNDEKHEKAVNEAIKRGEYEYIVSEDIDIALEEEKKRAMKLELMRLKQENDKLEKQLKSPVQDKTESATPKTVVKLKTETKGKSAADML